jgi:hypothetical protein
LLTGGWLHLIAIDGQETYRYTQEAVWELLQIDSAVSLNGGSV